MLKSTESIGPQEGVCNSSIQCSLASVMYNKLFRFQMVDPLATSPEPRDYLKR